jgi:NADP-dependent 3-hydroxy acid dehydrogenase YdfG
MFPTLRGKVILITGASSGIGAACASAFASSGCRLIILARRAARLQTLCEELRVQGAEEVLTVVADVTDRQQIERQLASLPDSFRSIDVVIHSAGLGRGRDKLQDGNPGDWEEVIRVSTVDPGMVETEFSVVRFRGDQERARAVYAGMTPMTGDDVAEAVLFCVSRPPHVNVSEVVLLATDQASATTVFRRPSS